MTKCSCTRAKACPAHVELLTPRQRALRGPVHYRDRKRRNMTASHRGEHPLDSVGA